MLYWRIPLTYSKVQYRKTKQVSCLCYHNTKMCFSHPTTKYLFKNNAVFWISDCQYTTWSQNTRMLQSFVILERGHLYLTVMVSYSQSGGYYSIAKHHETRHTFSGLKLTILECSFLCQYWLAWAVSAWLLIDIKLYYFLVLLHLW